VEEPVSRHPRRALGRAGALPRVPPARGLRVLAFSTSRRWPRPGHGVAAAGGRVLPPISALVGLKHFLLTGYWDPVHPAGLTILAAAIVGALLARKAFCGWVCPVGTVSRGLEWVGEKLFWRRRWPNVPRWLDLALSSLKYLILAFFAWAILWQMPRAALDGFMRSPTNVAADAKMLLFFLDLSATSAWVLGGLVLLSSW